MKTPREILLARHRAAEPKLDALRQAALATVRDRRATSDEAREWRLSGVAAIVFHTLWRELIFPCRRVWTGLAAVWILLFVVNLAQQDRGGTPAAGAGPSAPMVLAYYQQEKMLQALVADHTLPVDAVRPRSEISRAANI